MRVLVPLDGQWQQGDVVKSSLFGMWSYKTLDRDGWRDSTAVEVSAYEAAALTTETAEQSTPEVDVSAGREETPNG